MPHSVSRRRRAAILLTALFGAALVSRLPPALQPGLWADEIFSLAMATGHSLEHPAERADPARGDYAEPPGPVPPERFGRYVEHESPPAGAARVTRAVLLSDTSPPLYYLALDRWTRWAGTGDAALRLFSVLNALACLPCLWLLGRRLGGRRAAWGTCLLFGFAPAAVYYSAEGRMYAASWLVGCILALATLGVARVGSGFPRVLAWSVAGAAALLTHYFLGFVWAACAAWLLLHPGRARRGAVAAGMALTGLLVLPWYLQLPESLSAWRVTAGWQDGTLTWSEVAVEPLKLAWSLLSGRGVWGGSGSADRLGAALFAALAGGVLWRGLRPMLRPRRRLAWLWFLAAVLGPVAFDLTLGTRVSTMSRYALPGLPAAMLLGGLSLRRVPRPVGNVLVALILATWLPGLRGVYAASSRPWEPYPVVAQRLDAWSDPTSLIVVHSIPSGVIGVARYLEGSTPLVSWVGRLGRRQPGDMAEFVRGRCRTALVKIHDLDEPAPQQAWLHDHATLEGEEYLTEVASILYFAHPDRSGDRSARRCPAPRTPAPSDRDGPPPWAPRTGG